MADEGRRHRRAAVEARLHQIDAAARRVHLLAPQHVGRTRRQAEAAVHARVDQRRDRVDGSRRTRAWRGRSRAVGERRRSQRTPAGVQDAVRIERAFQRRRTAAAIALRSPDVHERLERRRSADDDDVAERGRRAQLFDDARLRCGSPSMRISPAPMAARPTQLDMPLAVRADPFERAARRRCSPAASSRARSRRALPDRRRMFVPQRALASPSSTSIRGRVGRSVARRLLDLRVHDLRQRREADEQLATIEARIDFVRGDPRDFERHRLELARHHRATTSASASAVSTPTRSVFDAAGSGASLNVALTIAARLPKDPVTSFDRS